MMTDNYGVQIEKLQATINQQAAEIDRLNAENEQMKSQFAGNVTIVKERFYPADKEMVEQLKAENDRLNAKVAELQEALQDLYSQGCGMPKSCDHDYHCVCPGEKAKAALSSTDTTWLDRKVAEAKREALEEAVTNITRLSEWNSTVRNCAEELQRMVNDEIIGLLMKNGVLKLSIFGLDDVYAARSEQFIQFASDLLAIQREKDAKIAVSRPECSQQIVDAIRNQED